jgi:hypothetical protein
MYIRIRCNGIAELLSHLPVPVRKEAIPPAIKDPQNKPGKSREREGGEIQFPQAFYNPSQQVKKDEHNVKDKEDNID